MIWVDACAKYKPEERTVVGKMCGWIDNAVVRKLRFGKSEVALLCSE